MDQKSKKDLPFDPSVKNPKESNDQTEGFDGKISSKSDYPSKPNKIYISADQEKKIITDISQFFRLLLISIIVGMLIFSVILLLLVIWRGVGNDIEKFVYSKIYGGKGGYTSIPDSEVESSNRIV